MYTLAVRPNVDVTGWLTYFITGLLQGYLLVLCFLYKRRQRALGVDDWGNALPGVEGDAERSRMARAGGETERERAEARSAAAAATVNVPEELEREGAEPAALMIGGRTYERRRSSLAASAGAGAGSLPRSARGGRAAGASSEPTERDHLLR